VASLEPPLDSKLLINGEISPEWWEWFSEIARPGGSVGSFLPSNVLGTTNEIDRSDNGTDVTLSLSETIEAPGTIAVDGKDLIKWAVLQG